MATALVIMVREGFEGALVVAIVFAYLRRMQRMDLAGAVWTGVGVALAISVGVGVVVHVTIGELVGVTRLRMFAFISALALIVLTWMVFWMWRQSRLIKSDLEHKVDDALGATDVGRALAGVALLAVLREGIEAALFLLAAATEDSGTRTLIGGAIGLAIAGVLAYAVYWGGRSLPMKAFFTVTGLVLIVFAAGLAARTVLFLQSSGDLGSANLNGVYDVRSVRALTQDTETGKFLAAMLGWDPRPSIEQVLAWLLYLVPVSFLFLRGSRPAHRSALSAVAAPTAERVVTRTGS